MTSTAESLATATPTLTRPALASILTVAVVALAAALQTAGPTNTDVSWLLTLGKRWMAGEAPYVDFIEVNPPASILLYMPAVLAGRLLGLRPEIATVAMVLAGAAASVVSTCRILRRAGLLPSHEGVLLPPLMLAALVLLPAGDFAEREHIALLAVLPLLAALAARIEGRPLALRAAVLAGVAGGLAMAVKPMFGLALAGPAALLMARRGWRSAVAAPELQPAWLVPAVYGAAVPFAFPRFTADILHMVLVAYVPLRQPIAALVLAPIALVFAALCALALLLMRRGKRTAWAPVLLLAAAGFHAAYLMQGKAWAYQALPGVLLAVLAVLDSFSRIQPAGLASVWRGLAALALGLLSAGASGCFDDHPTMGSAIPGLRQAIAAAAPRPTMLAIASDIAIGHPLVRDVGGRWVGSFPGEWITRNGDKLRDAGVSTETDAELERLSLLEKAIVARDVATRKPDVVLVYGPRWERYIAEVPALATAMTDYASHGVYGPVTLWVRRVPAERPLATGGEP